MDACRNCVFVTVGTKCPQCGETSTPSVQRTNLQTRERLYGSSTIGRYNEGLGMKTYGKEDMLAKASSLGLRPREPGEPRIDNKRRGRERARKVRSSIIRKELASTSL